MTIMVNDKGIRVLIPVDGKYLTNGGTYSTKVYLGKNADPADWWEVDEIPDETEDPELSAEEALDIIVNGGADNA
jgi:hypothetical protein